MSQDIPTHVMIKIDQIANRFEEEWIIKAERINFDPYLYEIEDDYRQPLLNALIAVDVELRREAKLAASPSDYRKWGDGAVDLVRKILNVVDGSDDVTIPQEQEDATGSHGGSLQVSSRQIGPYKLLQQIGEGGMGSVWMADQEKPIRRRVAIKLIRSDVGSREAIARFEAERQALAMMDHQNIAKVLDAGTTKQGRPYFVMELIKGVPINEYCDQNQLNIQDRLRLFIPVCQAVQHAHQKGIIHRDLKPSNVLVATVNNQAVPKVIDFGLAKALEHTTRLTDRTMFTEFGRVVGTLMYMSPEQAEGNNTDIDTRTDVYSLGVMLYELLTGSTPLDKQTVGKNALLNVLELIREKEPPKPSTRLSSSDQELVSSISSNRKIAISKLQSILRGELDWVVMRALEKDRKRRYETAAGIAEDIERYLNHEPVLAKPPSAGYQLEKFIQKNRGLVAALACMAALLLIGITTTSYGFVSASRSATKERKAKEQAIVQKSKAESAQQIAKLEAEKAKAQKKIADEKSAEAKREAERAQRAEALASKAAKRSADALKVFTNSFRSIDPDAGGTAEMSAKDVLFNAKKDLKSSDLDDLGKAELLDALTRSFLGLGEFLAAIDTSKESSKLREKLGGKTSLATLAALNEQAGALAGRGKIKDATDIMRYLLEVHYDVYGKDHKFTIEIGSNLGELLRRDRQLEKAAETLETVLETLRRKELKTGKPSLNRMMVMNNLAMTYADQQRFGDAAKLLEEAVAAMKQGLGDQHPQTLNAMQNLNLMYQNLGNNEQALRGFEDVHQVLVDKLGNDHPTTLAAKNGLANQYVLAGRLKEALKLSQEAYHGMVGIIGKSHPNSIAVAISLANVKRKLGELSDATKDFRDIISIAEKSLGESHPNTLLARLHLGSTLIEAKEHDLAIEALSPGYEITKKENRFTRHFYSSLLKAYEETDRDDELIEFIQDTIRTRSSQLIGENIDSLLAYELRLANAIKRRDLQEAELSAKSTLEKSIKQKANAETQAKIASFLGGLKIELEKYDEANELLLSAYAKLKSNPNVDREQAELKIILGHLIHLAKSTENQKDLERWNNEVGNLKKTAKE